MRPYLSLLPGYKQKTEGRNMLVYTIQALSRGKKGLKRGMIKPSMLPIEVKTKRKDINQVRIVPRKGSLYLGIEMHVCPPRHPQENGFVERYHRTYQLEDFYIPFCSMHTNSLPILYQLGSIFYSDNCW